MGVTFAISAQAKGDLIRAKERWIINHALEQATEYFLIAPPDDLKIPDDLLPAGFSAECTVEPVEEGLPEFADVEDYRGWKLSVYLISIIDPNGEYRDRQIVHKLLPKDFVY